MYPLKELLKSALKKFRATSFLSVASKLQKEQFTKVAKTFVFCFYRGVRSNIHSIKKIKKIFKKGLTFSPVYAIIITEREERR